MTGGLQQQARVLEATMAVKVFPVDVADAKQFPEIALALAGLAAMTPERRAELNAEWEA